MKNILKSALLCTAATTCLLTAACNSKGTTEVKQEAKAIDQSYKAQADLVEATAKNSPDKEAADNQADALRNQGEAIKDHLNAEAKEVQKDAKKQN